MFSKENITKKTPPRLPYRRLFKAVLASNYELSLVFVDEPKIKNFNQKYRKKDKPTNILSFPLSTNQGEIFICLPLAQTEARKVGIKISDYVGQLFIHGLLHLKGFRHGSTMEKEERKLTALFNLDGQKHHHRAGYRNSVH
jgi:probable rRNA maturation factor